MFNQRMPRLVEADNESEVSSSAASSIGSKSSLASGNKAGGMTYPSSLNRPRINPGFTGRMTLEFIEDFLNPICNRPRNIESHTGLLNLPTATGGFGLTMGIKQPDDIERMLSKKREKEEEAERSYRNLRRDFEAELIKLANEELGIDINNNSRGQDETSTVIGSGMHKIEQLSTMSCSSSQRAEIRKKTERLTRVHLRGENDSTHEQVNDNMSALEDLEPDAGRLINESRPLPEDPTPSERDATRLREFLKIYSTRNDYDPRLPITRERKRIVATIDESRFCIILGGTGCGKTTQVPQYILDAWSERGRECNIIVTQPRRIAAVSVARRVCDERGWRLGDICGYQIGLDRVHLSENTRICYVTTGVLLQKLINNNCGSYTHIIIDEVHERSLDTDFVLLVLKLQSYSRQFKVKVVLMSATFDTSLFRQYFAEPLDMSMLVAGDVVDHIPAPLIQIESCAYNVQEFYWDQLTDFRGSSPVTKYLQELYLTRYQSIYASIGYVEFDNLIGRQKSSSRRADEFVYSSQYRDRIRADERAAFDFMAAQMRSVKFDFDEPDICGESMLMVACLLRYFDELDIKAVKESPDFYDVDNELLETSDDEEVGNGNKPSIKSTTSGATEDKKNRRRLRIINGQAEQRSSVLIFVPGMDQIKDVQEMLKRELPDNKLTILPLHSDIVIDQQKLVFEPSQPCWRKVIISTTIAESSITVPDVKYVIDFCLTKELYCDPNTNYTHLRLEWASKSSLNQRRGRAGRVSDGMCFRLVNRRFLDELSEFAQPSILREPLHKVILDTKRLNQNWEPKRMLSMAIQPPKLFDIERTVLMLKEAGALTLMKRFEIDAKTVEYRNMRHDGDLTFVGRVMASLPISIKLSKLILLGYAFGMLRECIIIAAALSTKTFFTCYFKAHLEAFQAKWHWSSGWMCDCLAILNAYNVYENMTRTHAFDRRGEAEKWARSRMIELNRMREVEKLKIELESRLRALRIEYDDSANIYGGGGGENRQDDIKYHLILKMIICGAFYPNYFNSSKVDLQEAQKMVGGRDFKNTVQLKNMPLNEGILYTQQLAEIFSPCAKLLQVHFEDSRVYVEFKSKCESVPTSVNLGVYMAVQMRLLRFPMQLNRFNARITKEKLAEIEKKRSETSAVFTPTRDAETGINFSLNSTISSNASNRSFSSVIEAEESSISFAESEEEELNQTLRESDDDRLDDEDDDDFHVYSNRMGGARGQTNNNNPPGSGISSLSRKTYLQLNESRKVYDSEKGLLEIDKYSRRQAALDSSFLSAMSNKRMSSSTVGSATSGAGASHPLNSSRIKRTSETNDVSFESSSFSSSRMITTCRGDYRVQQLTNPRYVLPSQVDEGKNVWVDVVEVIECAHFWAVMISDDQSPVAKAMQKMHGYLNSPNYALHPVVNPEEGSLCAAYYYEDNIGDFLYRARIVSIDWDARRAKVHFVDFGNLEKKKLSELYELDDELFKYPFQAIECKLVEIKPDLVSNPNGVWTRESNKKFAKLVDTTKDLARRRYKNHMQIKVVDIEDDLVVMCKLYGCNQDSNIWEDVTDVLVEPDENGLAVAQRTAATNQLIVRSSLNVYPSLLPTATFGAPGGGSMMGASSSGQAANTNNRYYVPNRESGYMSKRPDFAKIDAELKKIQPKNNGRDIDDDESSSVCLSSVAMTTASSQVNNRTPSQVSSNKPNIGGGLASGRMSNVSTNGDYAGHIELRGPYSPLEVNYFALTNASLRKRVRIERDSINYVTLDDDPVNGTNRLLVAIDVSLNESGTSMILRKTCLMPKIAGLSSVCCLLFAPTIELRKNEKETFFSGALCGLGFDAETGQPIYKDNDIECAFDVIIDPMDLVMINKVRLAINMVIGDDQTGAEMNCAPTNLKKLQEVSCETLMKLILRKRNETEPVMYKRPGKWNEIRSGEILPMMDLMKSNLDRQESPSDRNKIYYTYHRAPYLSNAKM